MTTGSAGSALEAGKRLARVAVQAEPGAERDAELQRLLADLIRSRAETPEDALSLTAWSLSILQDVHARMPDDTPEAADVRFLINIVAALTGRTIEALETVTGVPRAAFSGQDRFSQ